MGGLEFGPKALKNTWGRQNLFALGTTGNTLNTCKLQGDPNQILKQTLGIHGPQTLKPQPYRCNFVEQRLLGSAGVHRSAFHTLACRFRAIMGGSINGRSKQVCACFNWGIER